jgi:dTDP-4-amino-4,6-dideoxygalactose transaminase
MKVPLLDLKPQYQALKQELDSAILRVAESQYFILGPEVDAFEKEMAAYIGVKHALGVSSGTDALLLALMALEVGPGDEVIVPTYSFFATAGVVARLKATPIFVDSDPVTFNIDPKKIRTAMTPRTRVIMPVHLYGQSAEMDEIMAIARDLGVQVVEDGAQAIGVQYRDGRQVGTIGDIGCFSFFPSKNLGGYGDGGLVTTNDDALFEKLKFMRVHGMNPKYYHKMVGGNFRLDAIQAAVLRVKLPHLNGWSAGRRKNAELYAKLFIEAGLAEAPGKTEFDAKNRVLLPKAVYATSTSPYTAGGTLQPTRNTEQRSSVKDFYRSPAFPNIHIFNQFIIRVKERDALREFFSKREVATEIYYPVPFHRQECFQYLKPDLKGFPVSDRFAAESMALPIYPELSEEQIRWVVESAKEFFEGKL